jgi:hypothetical protein
MLKCTEHKMEIQYENPLHDDRAGGLGFAHHPACLKSCLGPVIPASWRSHFRSHGVSLGGGYYRGESQFNVDRYDHASSPFAGGGGK